MQNVNLINELAIQQAKEIERTRPDCRVSRLTKVVRHEAAHLSLEAQLQENRQLNLEARTRRLAKEAKEKAARDKERALAQEQQRCLEEETVKTYLRGTFFLANADAGEADFERMYPSLRDEHHRKEQERLENAMRASYGRM